MVSEGFEYDNVPIGKAHGAEGLRSTLGGFFAMLEAIDWEILRQTSSGNLDRGTVLNERDDRVQVAGEWRTLPVCGVFEIEHGKITLWRDYFDRATLMTVMTADGK
jgi:limonene-1,2-epoxide hydrolase